MDQSVEGREGTPFEMTIEVGKVREIARATKSTNPEYRQDDSVIPPTFLAAAAFWQTETSSPSRGIPINLERMIHGGQEFIFHGEPPRVGDRLTGHMRIGKIWEKQGRRGGMMQFHEIITEFKNAEGTLVAESRTTAIETSQAPEKAGA